MTKVLKITKPDKTVHTAPLNNKAFYQAFNHRLSADKKWKIEEIDESEANDLPFRDKNFVTGLEALKKVEDQAKILVEKDDKIAQLESELAAKKAGKLPADLLVSLLANASAEQIEVLTKDDERKTVKEAADKRLAELAAAQ
jgi:hypothetical protein